MVSLKVYVVQYYTSDQKEGKKLSHPLLSRSASAKLDIERGKHSTHSTNTRL